MRVILLTKGHFAYVDDDNYERVSEHKWAADWRVRGQRFYAVRNERCGGGKKRKIYMHREVLGFSSGDRTNVDHRNRNTLDNRHEKLRTASTGQNAIDSKLYRTNTSGCRGVHGASKGKPWVAAIMVNYRNIRLGAFDTKEEAIAARREAEAKYFSEFVASVEPSCVFNEPSS